VVSTMTPSMTEPFAEAVTAAARALTPTTVAPAATFRWSAAGLVVEGGPERTGIVRVPAARGSTMVAPVAALGALLAALLVVRRPPAVARADVQPMLAPLPAGGPEEWLGFHRVGHGWLSLAAVGAAQRELAAFGLADARARGLSPAQSACRLQSLGLAALPSRAARAEAADSVENLTDAGALLGSAQETWQPLAGTRVLGLGRLVAAPHAVNLLEALGAQATRVRAPGDPEPTTGPAEVVDLRTNAGRHRLRDLAAAADVVVENYRPRAWEQLLPAQTRQLIARHVAVRGFPGDSPCRNWKVLGFMAEAAFGVGPLPVHNGPRRVRASRVPLWDRVAGTVAAAHAVTLLAADGGESETSLVGLARTIAPLTREVRR